MTPDPIEMALLTSMQIRMFVVENTDLLGKATVAKVRKRLPDFGTLKAPDRHVDTLVATLNDFDLFKWTLLTEYAASCQLFKLSPSLAEFRAFLKCAAGCPEEALPSDEAELLRAVATIAQTLQSARGNKTVH